MQKCRQSRTLLRRWLVNTKSNGIQTATRVASDGLQYAGQLSAAVLRVLLQVRPTVSCFHEEVLSYRL